MRARQIRRQIRQAFFMAFFHQIQIVSPILWGIILVMVIMGLLIGYIEGWKIRDALYFTFVTGLTIGYGDLTPRHIVSTGRKLSLRLLQAPLTLRSPRTSVE